MVLEKINDLIDSADDDYDPATLPGEEADDTTTEEDTEVEEPEVEGEEPEVGVDVPVEGE